jgi:hypothetical protein
MIYLLGNVGATYLNGASCPKNEFPSWKFIREEYIR